MSWRRMLEWSLIIDSWGFPININFQRSNASAAEEAVEEAVITPLPLSETYSGIDAGFYDSPSGETITPHTQITYGSGPSIFPPPKAPTTRRHIPLWEYFAVAFIAGPARIARFPHVLIEGGQILIDLLPEREEDMPQ